MCIHCKTEGEHQHIAGNHTEECPSYPLSCPLGCETELICKDLDTHRSTCPLEPVICPFKGLGCKTRVCRKDLNKHIETYTLQHIAVLAEAHTELQRKVQAAASLIDPAKFGANDIPTAQIYTILADTSTLEPSRQIILQLSETNEKSGQHYVAI